MLLLAASGTRLASAEFDTVLNVPPDELPAFPGFVGSNTQVNHLVGAATPGFFDVGDPAGNSVNVEFNLIGGTVYDEFNVNRGAHFNMTGGEVGAVLGANGSELRVVSGVVDLLYSDGNAQIRGGTIRELRSTEGALELFGIGFALDGVPIGGLLPGTPYTIVERGMILSGRLADGTEFAYSIDQSPGGAGSYVSPQAILQVTAVPEPTGFLIAFVGGLLGVTRRSIAL